MMARRILIFILLASLWTDLSFGASPQYKRKVTPENFQRTVRPLARTILGQFYSLLEKISPEQSEMIAVKQNIAELQILWNSWLRNCGELSSDCPNRLTEVHSRLIRVDKMILNMERKSYTIGKTPMSHEIDSQIDLMDTLDDMSNQCFLLLNAVEMQLINSGIPNPQKNAQYAEFSASLHFMHLNAERNFLNGLNDTIQQHFDFVWNTFLKDLELHVVIEGRSTYFAQRVEEFNINWNVFFSKMTSENFPIPEGSRSFLQNMHQNWNGILRQL